MGAVEGRELWSWGKMRKSRTHKDMHRENTFPKPLSGKMRRADFLEFYNQQGLKTGILKVGKLG